ncbi:FecR family protein [Vulgatibacter incomptus]|uniref:FecR protein domain-containing protein n=1 Tax=Vulgatibacter incomptus TaxID=1391653 RepID=A0A0K1PID4_9BACT|nr:FecR family protein [Vulgatibacter incomptus]AKU92874.1 hypothetical protein AKJ08_3261 [Vulgatibacter incomptus]
MDSIDELPIESLRALADARPTDAATRRIVEGALRASKMGESRAPSSPLFGKWMVPAFAAAAVAVVAVVGAQSDRQPEGLGEQGRHMAAAKADLRFPEKGSVQEASESETRFGVGPHRIAIEPGGRLRVELAEPNATELRVEQGRAHFDVEHLSTGQRFLVRTEQVLVEVVGTRFSVSSAGTCSVVAVDEGRVRITDAQGVQRFLSAGGEHRFCGDRKGTEAEGLLREALVLVSSGNELEKAAGLLSRFRSANPGGILGEEALYHLCLVEARLGHADKARALGDEFFASFPDSDRAERLREWLQQPAEVH